MTNEPGKMTEAGAVELQEEQLDHAAGGVTGKKVKFSGIESKIAPVELKIAPIATPFEG